MFKILYTKPTLIKYTTLSLLGYAYYQRDRINDFLHNRFSFYFDKYYDKDTNLQKLLKENLDLPIEVNFLLLNKLIITNIIVEYFRSIQHNSRH